MNKKWMALALALVMVLSSVSVLASSPSITTSDLTSDGGTLDTAVVSAISQHIASTGGAAIDYFGDDIEKQVARLLPSGVSAKNLVLYEAVAINTASYTESQLKSGISIDVPSGFADGATVIILVGIPDGLGGVEWFPVKATVSRGQLSLKLSSKVAKKFAASREPATFAVFGAA